MGNGFEGKLVFGVDVSRAIVAQGLGPSTRVVVADCSIVCALCMKLMVEQADAPFDTAPAGM